MPAKGRRIPRARQTGRGDVNLRDQIGDVRIILDPFARQIHGVPGGASRPMASQVPGCNGGAVFIPNSRFGARIGFRGFGIQCGLGTIPGWRVGDGFRPWP